LTGNCQSDEQNESDRTGITPSRAATLSRSTVIDIGEQLIFDVVAQKRR
jgi:hypothetical protein